MKRTPTAAAQMPMHAEIRRSVRLSSENAVARERTQNEHDHRFARLTEGKQLKQQQHNQGQRSKPNEAEQRKSEDCRHVAGEFCGLGTNTQQWWKRITDRKDDRTPKRSRKR